MYMHVCICIRIMYMYVQFFIPMGFCKYNVCDLKKWLTFVVCVHKYVSSPGQLPCFVPGIHLNVVSW